MNPYRVTGIGLSTAVVLLLLCASHEASAALINTTGGITLVSDGPTFATNQVPDNLALVSNGATPFALDELGLGIHLTAHINDGVYGNSNSWIGNGATGTSGPFVGVALPSAQSINSIAFGRDSLGMFPDRSLGSYTLQFTTVASPDQTTPDTDWSTIGTIDFSGGGGVNPPLTRSAARHQFNFAPVSATGVRLIVPGTGIGPGGTAIDELEIYSDFPTPPGLTLTETGPIGGMVPDNLALASNGATPFAKDLIGNGSFAPTHEIDNLNDGIYGNANSWIGESDATFAGVDLGGSFFIGQIAFGRDNTDMFTDRDEGIITVQYTTVDDPDVNTPLEDWITLDVLTYTGGFPDATPHLRHLYEFDPVFATGVRLVVSDGGLAGGIAIDEIEVFQAQPVVPEPLTAALIPLALGGLGLRRPNRGRNAAGAAEAR